MSATTAAATSIPPPSSAISSRPLSNLHFSLLSPRIPKPNYTRPITKLHVSSPTNKPITTASAAAKAATEETIYFDGGAHYGDLLANLLLGFTLFWLPLTLAAVSRAFFLRYRFTNLRVTVISGLTGEERSDFGYNVIKDVQVVPRLVGEWGDIIITLKDGTKVDLRSVPKFREIAKYCLAMADGSPSAAAVEVGQHELGKWLALVCEWGSIKGSGATGKEWHSMKRKSNSSEGEKKERHIVTWTQEEDDLLREQITAHGTDNWTVIASKFNDKTTRQCRRRWYTYLNSDFKKGGWTPEEDMLLCEAQKVYGNKWTEIAKVVSGRTDNAVKNRFSTLCKKRAKREAVTNENNNLSVNENSASILSHIQSNADERRNTTALLMIRRSHLPNLSEKYKLEKASLKECETAMTHKLRTPLAVLGQNTLKARHDSAVKNTPCDEAGKDRTNGGTFLKKDDPKIFALLQQAELLSSLAQKVNAEKTEQSLEDAWKVFQDYLNKNKENEIQGCQISDMDLHLEDFKDMLEDLRSNNEISQTSSWRQPDFYEESPLSSEYSTGSTLISSTAADLAPCQDTEAGLNMMVIKAKEGDGKSESKNLLNQATKQTDDSSDENAPKQNDKVASALSSTDFSSPPRVTPIFRSIAAEIPSPKFSESERNFLMKALGMESESRPSSNLKSSKISPTCKRALLHSL
ncbi:unnamed protein product [Rhodiola kirilowii]